MTSPLNAFAHDQRHVAWRTEMRGGKPTKVPYGRDGHRAKTDDPATWLTRVEAQQTAARIVNGCDGGTGIVLGDLGTDLYLGGLDLDSCLSEDGTLAEWAAKILSVTDTYSEVSPSGRGVKLFFYIGSADVRPFLGRIGVPPDAWGCRRGIPGRSSQDHGPAVELYVAKRYFAVTENRWPGAPDTVRLLDTATLDRLADLIPGSSQGQRNGTGGDTSRSAIAFNKVWEWRRHGTVDTFDKMVEALYADADTAEWTREKGEASNRRELHRLWERTGVDDRPPQLSDEGLALRFTATHAHEARYVAQWGKWLFWDGCRWKPDVTLAAFDQARAICREASTEAPPVLRRVIASSGTVAAVVNLARSDRRHAALADQWDADPWLLNTPVGIVDLRTGGVAPHEPALYISKMTACAPASGDCPGWLRFLERVTGGNGELQAYLARVAGYALTGSIREHALFFLHGAGANGKGVFINTLTAILGDYATVAPMETFIASRAERHPTDLAGLRGARLVTAQETEQGRRWAEAKIKALTGGDPISARFMRQDFFTFLPVFKLIIAGNHKPQLRDVDEAIRRRFNLIPFDIVIPAAEQDRNLPEKLRAEWPGILQWAIDGCLEWQRIGLDAPAVVREATESYFGDEDAISQWIGECCDCAPTHSDASGSLYGSWKAWATAINEAPGTQKSLVQALEKRGFSRNREGGTGKRLIRGLKLRPPPGDML